MHTGRMRSGGQRGQSIVEFALLLPLVLIILFAIFDFGLAYSQYETLQSAVQEAMDQAQIGASNAQIQAAFAQNLQSMQSSAQLAISPAAEPRLPGTSVTMTGTYTYRPVMLEVVGIDVIPMQYLLTGEVQ